MRRPAAVLIAIAATVSIVAAVAGPATAHDLEWTRGSLRLSTDGSIRLELIVDLDALALGSAADADDAELAAALAGLEGDELEATLAQLRATLQRRVRVLLDGAPTPLTISFPDRGQESRGSEPPSFLGLTARFDGLLPAPAQRLQVRISRAFPPLQLTIRDDRYGIERSHLMERGEESPPYRLDERPTAPGVVATLARYGRLGFLHIVPRGADHVLFVLGLFLLSSRVRPLLWQITAFTAAHTVTLGLAAAGVVRLSPGLVEPLIALSIAYVGAENAMTDRLTPWRPLLVFAFGLLHGLGFAGVLGEIGLPAGQRTAALLGFNVGVELGQLAVIGAAALLLAPLRGRSWYRRRVTLPLSLLIGATGMYWAVTRWFLGG